MRKDAAPSAFVAALAGIAGLSIGYFDCDTVRQGSICCRTSALMKENPSFGEVFGAISAFLSSSSQIGCRLLTWLNDLLTAFLVHPGNINIQEGRTASLRENA